MWSTADIIHVCRGNSPAMWTRFRINKFSDHTNKLPSAGNTLISLLNRAGNCLQAFWEKPQQFGFPSLSYTGKNLSSKLHGNSYCPNVEFYFMCTVWWWLQIPRCVKLKIIKIFIQDWLKSVMQSIYVQFMKNCENTLKKECVVLSFLLQTIIIISSSSYCSSSCTITITCLCFLLPSDFLFLRNLSQHVLSNLKYHNKYIFEPMTLSKCMCVQHPHGVSHPLDQCVLSLR